MDTSYHTISTEDLVSLDDIEHKLSDRMEALLEGDVKLNIEKIELAAEQYEKKELFEMLGIAVVDELEKEGINL